MLNKWNLHAIASTAHLMNSTFWSYYSLFHYPLIISSLLSSLVLIVTHWIHHSQSKPLKTLLNVFFLLKCYLRIAPSKSIARTAFAHRCKQSTIEYFDRYSAEPNFTCCSSRNRQHSFLLSILFCSFFSLFCAHTHTKKYIRLYARASVWFFFFLFAYSSISL